MVVIGFTFTALLGMFNTMYVIMINCVNLSSDDDIVLMEG